MYRYIHLSKVIRKYWKIKLFHFTEQEHFLVLQVESSFVLFLDCKGIPSVKFLSIEKVKHAHADRFKNSLLEAFERLKLTGEKNFLN